jgi:two-component system response regulator AtoC
MLRILIIEDDELLARTLALELEEMGHEIRHHDNFTAGSKFGREWQPELILLDMHLPDQDDLQHLPAFCDSLPESYVVIMTGDPDSQAVLQAMRGGACDFLRKPMELEDIQALVSRIDHCHTNYNTPVSQQCRPAEDRYSTREIIGTTPLITELLKNIGLLSRSTIPVLIEGESGTGKELVARILHDTSSPDQPFVAINCAAIVPTLLESELFGHEKGAFTGAEKTKIGKLQFADRGTILLDEIGDMPLEMQGKLMRVLQEEEFVRVGGLQPIPLRARVITATNQDLRQAVQTGKFREDLYFRLAVSCLSIPPLRERREDIPQLINYYLARIAKKLQREIASIEQEALEKLQQYDWPGNVRELENMLTKALALSTSKILAVDSFDFSPPSHSVQQYTSATGLFSLSDIENSYIHHSLIANKWHITKTAKQLGISQTTLRKKIAEYDLCPCRRISDPTT